MSSSIHGIQMVPLDLHSDTRGGLIEVFRAEWNVGDPPLQWNVVHSVAGALRGFHVHAKHTDYLTVLSGKMRLGLKDIRRGSPSYNFVETHELAWERTLAVCIPPGVAHGFYFPEPSIHLYGVSHYWSTVDEMGCRWNDPQIGIDWKTNDPLLSERDAHAASYDRMLEDFHRLSSSGAP